MTLQAQRFGLALELLLRPLPVLIRPRYCGITHRLFRNLKAFSTDKYIEIIYQMVLNHLQTRLLVLVQLGPWSHVSLGTNGRKRMFFLARRAAHGIPSHGLPRTCCSR
jgi:hypothetical protein